MKLGWKVFVYVLGGIFLFILANATFLYFDTDFGQTNRFTRTMVIKAGSYTGRVVDDATGRPIEGAAVYMFWVARRRLNPLEGMLMFDHYVDDKTVGDYLVFTDKDGNYRTPAEDVSRVVHWRARLLPVECVIYKKGYVGYNSQHGFDGRERYSVEKFKNYFRKKDNLVRLKPWQDKYSHRSHFHFINSVSGLDSPHRKAFAKLFEWESDSRFFEEELGR